MTMLEVRRLKEWGHENTQLMQIVADFTLNNRILRNANQKVMRLSERRRMVDLVKSSYTVSERSICRILSLSRAPYR